MTSMAGQATDVPVRKSITVKASVEDAFDVFTDDMDSWWPREHHIGKSPMKRMVVEPKVGGRCYTEQEDGTDCDWGSVLAWEPPHRFVMAWRITTKWEYEPDLWKSSEVEVRFTPIGDGLTRVDLEHRYLERHGPGFESLREYLDRFWDQALSAFRTRVESHPRKRP